MCSVWIVGERYGVVRDGMRFQVRYVLLTDICRSC